MSWPVDALNGSDECLPGSISASTIALPESYDPSLHRELIDSLTRQTMAMERLADLLPQLLAINQALLEAIADREDDEPEATYLDGSPR